MYILTSKALEKREQKAYMKGNKEATEMWQREFQLQAQNMKATQVEMLKMLEKIVLEDTEIYNMKTKKDLLLHSIQEKQNELLNTIKMLKEG